MSNRFWKRIITSLAFLMLATASLLAPSYRLTRSVEARQAFVRQPTLQESSLVKDKDYKCVKREASATPPPRLAPNLYTKTKGYEQIPRPSQTPSLKSLCREGEVPVSVSTAPLRFQLEKGNPLIGPVKGGQDLTLDSGRIRAEMIRKSLRPFNKVYWKGRGQGASNPSKQSHAERNHPSLFLEPQAACDGVPSFGSCYYYASAAFRRQADGGGMTMSVERPTYVSGGGGGHTLNEMGVVRSNSGGITLEFVC